MAPPDESRPFAEAPGYYARFRPPYAREAIDFVCAELSVDGHARVLDLGCGPGILTLPLAARAAKVTAVDPEPGMIAEGRRRAAAAGLTNIDWVERRAEEIGPDLGRFRAAVLGQSFHWMERDVVLARLAEMVEDGGGLALVGPGRRRPVESWEPLAYRVIARFLGEARRHPRANPDEPTNEPALERSAAFDRLEFMTFEATHERDVGSILGCLYSFSASPPSAFGDRREAFEAELAAELLAANRGGIFVEKVATEVTIARKRESRAE